METLEMTPYIACGLIEGYVEAEGEEHILEAWSYIGKTKLYTQLQGFYGRTLSELIDNGILDNNFNITDEYYEYL
jgi:hypothetical protein